MKKEGGFVNRPQILDGSNHEYWKARMVALIKCMDNKAWKSIVKGWEPPNVKDKDGLITNVPKAEEDWDDEDDKLAQGNSKSLNALFNGVDKSIFRLISSALLPKRLGKFSRLLMKELLRQKYLDFIYSPLNLKI